MIAWMFPGQGSQKVGMGAELLASSQAAQRLFAEASDVLGFDLAKLCLEGPEEQLTATENAQPAILTLSIALLHEYQANYEDLTAFVAGHSLGEYSALVAAQALSFTDALRCVRRRGELMAETTNGTMAAIIGLELEPLLQICEQVQAEHGVCVVANQNAPGQLVISGTLEAVAAASAAAKSAGAKRTMPLPVSAAFHSPLMQQAAQGLGVYLEHVAIQAAQIPVIANSNAQIIRTAEEIRHELVEQITAPVRWIDTVRYFDQQGVIEVVEIGPGNVLTGLAKRIAPALKRQTINGPHADTAYSKVAKISV